MTEATIFAVLPAALASIGAASKNKSNPAFKGTKYADLGSVIDAIRPITEHGLWFRQVSHEVERGVSVETLYVHATGELSAGRVFVPASKTDAQGYGSAQTYARRYGLQLAFGLATEDDDGNSAAASVRGEGQSKESAVSPHPDAIKAAVELLGKAANLKVLQAEWESTGADLKRNAEVQQAKDDRKAHLLMIMPQNKPPVDDDLDDEIPGFD